MNYQQQIKNVNNQVNSLIQFALREDNTIVCLPGQLGQLLEAVDEYKRKGNQTQKAFTNYLESNFKVVDNFLKSFSWETYNSAIKTLYEKAFETKFSDKDFISIDSIYYSKVLNKKCSLYLKLNPEVLYKHISKNNAYELPRLSAGIKKLVSKLGGSQCMTVKNPECYKVYRKSKNLITVAAMDDNTGDIAEYSCKKYLFRIDNANIDKVSICVSNSYCGQSRVDLDDNELEFILEFKKFLNKWLKIVNNK